MSPCYHLRSSVEDGIYHKRMPNFEVYDHIELKVIPRWKSSGLSGDEWRTSVRIRLYFKGELIHESDAFTMDLAIKMLGWIHECEASIEQGGGIPLKVQELEKQRCDQPGCCEMAERILFIKQQFSDRGHKLDPRDYHGKFFRQFCHEHSKRGDASREDCCHNYQEQS